jgi:hypothetical protein
MDISINQDVAMIDRVKIQAQVLVPVIEAFRREIGTQRANEILSTALQDWSRDLHRREGARQQGSPRQKWEALMRDSAQRNAAAIELDVAKAEPNAFEFNVTSCRYAEFFKEIGEPELGRLLLCDTDVYVAEVGSPEVAFTRSQTIMQGAPHCDFRYRMRESDAPGGSY